MAGGQSEREDKVSLELNEEIFRVRKSNGRISSMDFHRASNYLVTASDNESICLYDVSDATQLINSKKYGVDLVCVTCPHECYILLEERLGWVVSLSLCSRNDHFISGSLDRTVLFWDQRADNFQGLLCVHGRPATAYNDQGLVFAIASGGYIRIFDVRNYEKGPFDIFSVGGVMSDANVVKYSNDGRLMLLTTTDGHIHVLDSFRGKLLYTYNVKPVSSSSTPEASFSPEGRFVVSGSGDGSVYAWSVRSGKETPGIPLEELEPYLFIGNVFAACWMSSETEPCVIKCAPGSLMFVSGSSELSFWIPDLSKLATYVGRK